MQRLLLAIFISSSLIACSEDRKSNNAPQEATAAKSTSLGDGFYLSTDSQGDFQGVVVKTTEGQVEAYWLARCKGAVSDRPVTYFAKNSDLSCVTSAPSLNVTSFNRVSQEEFENHLKSAYDLAVEFSFADGSAEAALGKKSTALGMQSSNMKLPMECTIKVDGQAAGAGVLVRPDMFSVGKILMVSILENENHVKQFVINPDVGSYEIQNIMATRQVSSKNNGLFKGLEKYWDFLTSFRAFNFLTYSYSNNEKVHTIEVQVGSSVVKKKVLKDAAPVNFTVKVNYITLDGTLDRVPVEVSCVVNENNIFSYK